MQFYRSKTALTSLTLDQKHDVLVKLCRPLIVSDNSISDRWRDPLVTSVSILMQDLVQTRISERDAEILEDVLQQLIRFVGNDSSECSDDQVKLKHQYKRLVAKCQGIRFGRSLKLYGVHSKVTSRYWGVEGARTLFV